MIVVVELVQFVVVVDYNCCEDTVDKILMENLNNLVYDEVGYDSLKHDVVDTYSMH